MEHGTFLTGGQGSSIILDLKRLVPACTGLAKVISTGSMKVDRSISVNRPAQACYYVKGVTCIIERYLGIQTKSGISTTDIRTHLTG